MGRFLGIIPQRGVAKVTNSRLFEKLALKSFDECDKLYDKLNDKLPCHLRVPSPEDVHTLYERHAPASDRGLGKQEYLEVAADLFADAEHWWDSILVKVAVTAGLQLALFPLVGRGLGAASKATGLPVIRRMSPVLWAHAVEKLYKVVRISAPELP